MPRSTVAAILDLHGVAPRFTVMVGTGGIGHGTFFLLEGNASLGREESRAGRILDRRDYCKLHIISHYVKGLLGDACAVYPVGRVGDDPAGTRLMGEMAAAGLDMRFVRAIPGAPTLFSFCYLYPDGTGGNMTTADSASGRVDPAAVREAEEVMARAGASGIALAVPEVPLAARAALIEAAARHGLFTAASFTRAEMPAAREQGLLGKVDLLAVNLEEALAAASMSPARAEADTELLARKAADKILSAHPGMLVSITAGAAGSWAGNRDRLTHQPALPVKVAGTSGAGDAHFAGLLAGLCAGLDLADSQALAALMGAASVTSPHHPSGHHAPNAGFPAPPAPRLHSASRGAP
jgi:ribokinase